LVLFVGDPDLARKRYGLAKLVVDTVGRSIPTQMLVGWGKPHHEIVGLMNACDALLFTSMQEGSPNVVKEALACNLPVVSVRVGDVALRLRGIAGCELCPDDRVETIAAALERVLQRRERIDGRVAVQDLNERLLTQRLIGIYRSVMSPSKSTEACLAAGLLIS
jgi:teichuronic acid biosynthesis glycosyltransferase TuaC